MDSIGVKVTPRDRQVLNLLVQGRSNKEIAGQLSISPRTVKQPLRTLFVRAGIRDGRKRVKLGSRGVRDQEVIQRCPGSTNCEGNPDRSLGLARAYEP